MKYTKFQNRMVNEFGLIHSSNKLEKFYDTSFNDFLNEISRVSKIKMSLRVQDEWEDYFNSYKRDLLEVRSEIVKNESMLNLLVFELYRLNESEKKFIEDDNAINR